MKTPDQIAEQEVKAQQDIVELLLNLEAVVGDLAERAGNGQRISAIDLEHGLVYAASKIVNLAAQRNALAWASE